VSDPHDCDRTAPKITHPYYSRRFRGRSVDSADRLGETFYFEDEEPYDEVSTMSVRTTRSDSIGLPTTPSRYDLLLALLPVPLLLGAFVSAVTSVPTVVGVGAGCVPSAALFGYAILIAPPTGRERRTSEPSA
jgi:hypothetical protein